MREEPGPGAEFFLSMAQRTQKSPKAVRAMIDEVCRPLADTRPVLLSKVYNAYQEFINLTFNCASGREITAQPPSSKNYSGTITLATVKTEEVIWREIFQQS